MGWGPMDGPILCAIGNPFSPMIKDSSPSSPATHASLLPPLLLPPSLSHSMSQPEGEAVQVSEISPNALMDALKEHPGPLYTKSKLPPLPGKPYVWKLSQDEDPADPHTYFPMKNYA